MVNHLTREERAEFVKARRRVQSLLEESNKLRAAGNTRAGDVFQFWLQLYHYHMDPYNQDPDFYFDPDYSKMINDMEYVKLARAFTNDEDVEKIAWKIEDFYFPHEGMTRVEELNDAIEAGRSLSAGMRQAAKLRLENRLTKRMAMVNRLDAAKNELEIASGVPDDPALLAPFRDLAIQKITGLKEGDEHMFGAEAAMIIRLFDMILRDLALRPRDERTLISMVLQGRFMELSRRFGMYTTRLHAKMLQLYGSPVEIRIPTFIYMEQKKLTNFDTKYPYIRRLQEFLQENPGDDAHHDFVINAALDEMERSGTTSARLPSVVDHVFSRRGL